MIINAPLEVYTPKKYIVNLNRYRNWHYMVNNNVKKAYCEALYEQLYKLRLETPIELEFTLYKARNVKIDRANVLSIHEKYFCDALVHYGCIEDDNDEYIKKTTYLTGGVDRKNPRVEIELKPYKTK